MYRSTIEGEGIVIGEKGRGRGGREAKERNEWDICK